MREIVKVFQCRPAGYQIVFHLGNLIPSPVFDTQVAAMVCGFGDAISYDQLVQKVTGEAPRTSPRGLPTGAAARFPTSNSIMRWRTVTYLRDICLYLKEEFKKKGAASG